MRSLYQGVYFTVLTFFCVLVLYKIYTEISIFILFKKKEINFLSAAIFRFHSLSPRVRYEKKLPWERYDFS